MPRRKPRATGPRMAARVRPTICLRLKLTLACTSLPDTGLTAMKTTSPRKKAPTQDWMGEPQTKTIATSMINSKNA